MGGANSRNHLPLTRLSNGVMAALQILVLSVQVRVLVGQQAKQGITQRVIPCFSVVVRRLLLAVDVDLHAAVLGAANGRTLPVGKKTRHIILIAAIVPQQENGHLSIGSGVLMKADSPCVVSPRHGWNLLIRLSLTLMLTVHMVVSVFFSSNVAVTVLLP